MPEAGTNPLAYTVDVPELTSRLGLPDHEQSAVAAWANAGAGARWTEAEAVELIAAWRADRSGEQD